MVLPIVYAVAAYAAASALQAAPTRKPDPAILSVQLQWVRQDPAATPGGTAPDPVVLSRPRLTTTDGQVASIELKSEPKPGVKNLFFVSLSPTLEPADNATVAGDTAARKGPTVRVLWNLRVMDKTFPGGVESVALTGAARFPVGAESDTAVARFSLADPKTGALTEYRLVGRAAVGDDAKGDDAKNAAAVPVTSPPAAPY